MNRVGFLIINVASALAALAFVQCGDDEGTAPVTPARDGQADTEIPDAGLGDVAYDSRWIPSERKWRPQVFAMDLRPQPNAMFAPAPDNDPGFHVPLVVVNNESFTPKRAPDLVVDSKNAGGIGFGCVGYKFSPANPLDPKGPGITHGDMGTVTLTGHTGGKYVQGPPPVVGTDVPKTITCQRSELLPGSGLFGYSCGSDFPATGFLAKTDMLTANAAGGADLKAWTLTTPPSSRDDLVVTTDLWAVTPQAVDGSADLKIEYNCGGGPCGMAQLVNVIIQTSDGRDSDAAPPSPFDFPTAKGEFGLINCVDFLSFNGTGFTVTKELLALLPPTWTDLRVVVSTVNSAVNQVDGQPTTLGAGFARFGITHR